MPIVQFNQSIATFLAHRGASQKAPENTIASLKAAKQYGAKWVEFDVRMTKDKEPIVFHDSSLKRTTGTKGYVYNTNFKEIKHLDAGSWFSNQFKNEKVPHLTEYLQEAAQLKLGINLEIKASKNQNTDLVRIVNDYLNQYWPTSLPLPIISSSSTACLKALRKINTKYRLAYIMNHWTKQWISMIKRLNCYSIHISYKNIKPTAIKKIKAAGYTVLAYTVNELEALEKLHHTGVDGFITDNLSLLDWELEK